MYGRSDGERIGSVSVPQSQIRALAVNDGMTFVLAESGLSAVSVPDGSEQWSGSGESDYAQADSLALGCETVVVPVLEPLDSLPSIAAFQTTAGTPQWCDATDEPFSPTVVVPPVNADGAVYAMSNTKPGVTARGPPAAERGDCLVARMRLRVSFWFHVLRLSRSRTIGVDRTAN